MTGDHVSKKLAPKWAAQSHCLRMPLPQDSRAQREPWVIRTFAQQDSPSGCTSTLALPFSSVPGSQSVKAPVLPALLFVTQP